MYYKKQTKLYQMKPIKNTYANRMTNCICMLAYKHFINNC